MRRVASNRSVLASTLRTNDLPYRVQKSRNFMLDGIPQNVGVQSEVHVGDDIPQTRDLSPGHVRIAVGYKYSSDVESPDVQDLAPLAVVGRGGRRILREIATIVSPDTILAWHRKLIARTTYRPLGQTTPGCCRTGPASSPNSGFPTLPVRALRHLDPAAGRRVLVPPPRHPCQVG